MFRKTLGVVAIIAGVIGMIISLAADMIGVGQYPGINQSQLPGAAVGLLITIAGVLLVMYKREEKKG